MTYDILCEIIKRSEKVKIRDLSEAVEDLFTQAAYDKSTSEYYLNLVDLFDVAIAQSRFEGSADDFHNLSVQLAREEEYEYACQVLEKGLQRFPYSVDLLADYLNYGMQCGRAEQCEKYYETLSTLRNRWNWRAYQFSIDYLRERLELDPTAKIEPLRELVEEFINRNLMREECYLEKAKLIRDFGVENTSKLETYVSILEYAISDKCPIQRTPKCDLSLADYYYDEGKNLPRALEIIERCKRDSVEVQFSVNRNYVYLLAALCRISMFYDSAQKNPTKRVEEGSEQEQEILRIYSDYHVALTDRTDSRARKCKNIIEVLVRETAVPYPYDDDIEND